MKFFIDTANLSEIREAASLGIIDGCTTNPTLLSKEKGSYKEILAELCTIIEGPVSAEVVSLDAEGMVKEGKELCKIADNIIIKVPCIREGIKALGIFKRAGIQTNATLCFSANQGLLVAKAGATFVGPFVTATFTSWDNDSSILYARRPRSSLTSTGTKAVEKGASGPPSS